MSENSSDDEFACESENCDEDDDGTSPLESPMNVQEIKGSSDEASGSDTDECAEEEDTYSPGLIHWILVIFFKIQYRYNLTKSAASAILSFISLIFSLLSHPLSGVFPKTVSSAMSATRCQLQNSMPKSMYVVCPRGKCNALYKVNEHPLTCTQTTFNKVCGATLGYERSLSHGRVKWTPHKKFQFIKPSSWLQHMFQSSEFLHLIELWKSKMYMMEEYGMTRIHWGFSQKTTLG